MFKWIKDLFFKCYNNRVLRYIFYGGLATLVNLGSYYLMRHFIPSLPYTAANIISVALAILFAYYTNSRFVFRSKANGFHERFGEFVKFVSARLSTLVIEVGGVWVMSEFMGIDDRLGKFIVQFIVLVLNYIFSKFLVFKKR